MQLPKESLIILLSVVIVTTALSSTAISRKSSINMVEGHSVHRVASMHRKRLVGKSFFAWSPNGRFTEGANAINGKVFSGIEAVGKNLFAFFEIDNEDTKRDDKETVVMHVHFGMAGNWAVYMNEDAPEPSKTNRLRLEYPGIVADLSAMTVQHGGMDLYDKKRAMLGEDPLRRDADPERLWSRIQKSSKSIGALIMDQSYFTGPGNIYRAEICFKAGIHPNRVGKTLQRQEFDRVWYHTKALLQRGYETGSILTVDPEEAKALGNPRMRRYIYNTAKCPRCHSSIKSWQIASRTCYACPKCQPLNPESFDTTANMQKDVVPFNSHCARESVESRLSISGPTRLTVKELKVQLATRGIAVPSNAKKATLVEALLSETKTAIVTPERETEPDPAKRTVKELKVELRQRNVRFPSNAKKSELVDLFLASERQEKTVDAKTILFVSSEAAAAEKADAGESLAVEHIAELAPGQMRKARAQVPNKAMLVPDIISSDITINGLDKSEQTKQRRSKRTRKIE